MLKLTENQIRQLIRQILMEKIDPDKYDRQGGRMANHPGASLDPGSTVGDNPAGDWRKYDLGQADTGDEHDVLDEVEEPEDEEE